MPEMSCPCCGRTCRFDERECSWATLCPLCGKAFLPVDYYPTWRVRAVIAERRLAGGTKVALTLVVLIVLAGAVFNAWLAVNR